MGFWKTESEGGKREVVWNRARHVANPRICGVVLHSRSGTYKYSLEVCIYILNSTFPKGRLITTDMCQLFRLFAKII